ncbi:MAG: H-type lectin domain-containing protein [Gammaproteobacteria bacterium]
MDVDVPLANVAIVHVGLSGFDMDNRDWTPMSVRMGAISATGFELLVVTWLNTLVYEVEVAPLAVGHQPRL